jgi:hypothetical protein
MFSRYFEPALWWTLPKSLKQRWWRETEYGSKEPSAELLQVIKELLVAEVV